MNQTNDTEQDLEDSFTYVKNNIRESLLGSTHDVNKKKRNFNCLSNFSVCKIIAVLLFVGMAFLVLTMF